MEDAAGVKVFPGSIKPIAPATIQSELKVTAVNGETYSLITDKTVTKTMTRTTENFVFTLETNVAETNIVEMETKIKETYKSKTGEA